MYDFILNMWIMRRKDSTWVNGCVTKNYITQDQANTIIATPQIA